MCCSLPAVLGLQLWLMALRPCYKGREAPLGNDKTRFRGTKGLAADRLRPAARDEQGFEGGREARAVTAVESERVIDTLAPLLPGRSTINVKPTTVCLFTSLLQANDVP